MRGLLQPAAFLDVGRCRPRRRESEEPRELRVADTEGGEQLAVEADHVPLRLRGEHQLDVLEERLLGLRASRPRLGPEQLQRAVQPEPRRVEPKLGVTIAHEPRLPSLRDDHRDRVGARRAPQLEERPALPAPLAGGEHHQGAPHAALQYPEGQQPFELGDAGGCERLLGAHARHDGPKGRRALEGEHRELGLRQRNGLALGRNVSADRDEPAVALVDLARAALAAAVGTREHPGALAGGLQVGLEQREVLAEALLPLSEDRAVPGRRLKRPLQPEQGLHPAPPVPTSRSRGP